MPVSLLIPTPLRPFAGQQSRLEVAGSTAREVLDHCTTRHPELRAHLFHPDGRLRSFVNVYVNDDDVRQLVGLDTPVSPGDIISIVPSVAGGAPVATLSNDEVARYSRHLIVPEVGVEGQQRLKAAKVLCVGAGGLGSPAALYLTAAGVGTLGLVDFDTVDISNLQRQILYSTEQVGQPKLAAAAARLTAMNPHVAIRTHDTRLTQDNALDIVNQYDIVVDGADNFATRYLVNDACVLTGRTNVYGSIFRFDGQASVFGAPDGPCYRCLYPEPPPPGLVPSCAEGGVLGVLPGLVGTIQATEAVKLIVGAGTTLVGRLLLVDALAMTFRSLTLRRDPACPICGDHPSITALVDYEQFCGLPASSPAMAAPPSVSVDEFRARLDAGQPAWILDVREPNEFDICRIPGSTLIPLGELPGRLGELTQRPAGTPIVVHCKMGGRSAKAVALLQKAGIADVWNLSGGILAWIDRVDPSLPRY
jgi:adenylyltransferase/sulfurtransferase